MSILNVAFLAFRLRRLINVIRTIPIPYLAVLLLLIAAAVAALIKYMTDEQSCAIVDGVALLLVLAIHLRRRDYRFVCLVEEHPLKVFAFEYVVLLLPLYIIGMANGCPLVSLGVLAGGVLIGAIRQPRRRAFNIYVPAFIPVELFELRSGFRKNGLLMAFFYLASLAALFAVPYLPLALMWFIVLITTDLFVSGEPLSILCASELGERQFIRRKLTVYLRFFGLMALPVCLLHGIIYSEVWQLPCIFFLLSAMNIGMIILSKYAFYRPCGDARHQQAVQLISFVGILIPFIAPLTVFLLFRYYNMSVRNLKTYLYAYN